VEYPISSFMLYSLMLFWLVLIFSCIFSWAVGYITCGDKSVPTVLQVIKPHLKVFMVEEDEFLWPLTVLFGITCVCVFLSILINGLEHKGLGHAVLIVLAIAVTTVALMKLGRFAYRVNRNLNKHVEDKQAHK
jgi:hypothetical protein